MISMEGNIVLLSSTGVIGSYLYEQLQNNFSNNLIGTFYKSKNSKQKFFVDLGSNDSITKFLNKIKNINTLIFTVGLAHKKGKDNNFDEFKNINHDSLVRFMDTLEKFKIAPQKIIFLSSISIYGEKFSKKYYFEDSITSPISPYARTKLLAENYLIERYRDKVWILRLAPVYSREFRLNILRRTEFFGLKYKVGNGENRLSLCHINNISCVIKSIIYGEVPHGIYNISDEKTYTFEDILVKKGITIAIPKFIINIVFYIGKITKNIFLLENSIKLLSDNIFPSSKIQKYIDLKYNFNDCKN